MKAQVRTSEALDQKKLLKVLTAFKRGDVTVRMPEDGVGLGGKMTNMLCGVLELSRTCAGSSGASAEAAHSYVAATRS
jgi:hypothetical protein